MGNKNSGRRPMQKIDEYDRAVILTLYRYGFPVGLIAKLAGLSYMVVYKAMNKTTGTMAKNHKKISDFVEKINDSFFWEDITK